MVIIVCIGNTWIYDWFLMFYVYLMVSKSVISSLIDDICSHISDHFSQCCILHYLCFYIWTCRQKGPICFRNEVCLLECSSCTKSCKKLTRCHFGFRYQLAQMWLFWPNQGKKKYKSSLVRLQISTTSNTHKSYGVF